MMPALPPRAAPAAARKSHAQQAGAYQEERYHAEGAAHRPARRVVALVFRRVVSAHRLADRFNVPRVPAGSAGP